MRYLISGGTVWHHKFAGKIRLIYALECVHRFFGSRWEGSYGYIEDVVKHYKNYLTGVDLWWVSLHYNDRNRNDIQEAIRFAKSQGTIVMGEPNGPFHANLFTMTPKIISAWKEVSCFTQANGNPDTIAAYEKVYSKPYFGCPPPVDLEMHIEEFMMTKNLRLKYKPEDKFVLGHAPSHENIITIQAAENFGVPLIVNYDNSDPGLNAWIKEMGEFKHVEWRPILPHYEWLWQLQNSLGIFYMTMHPSTGRATLYAALAGKISISIGATWQEILFPNAIIPFHFSGALNWKEYAARAEKDLPFILDRIQEYSPEKCQDKLETFLCANKFVQSM